MSEKVGAVTSELDEITAGVRAKFARLCPEQLNWKPSAESWSVGQCIDHLIKTSEIYSQGFAAVADGRHQAGFWERWSPLSSFFGKFLTRYMAKDEKKVKTSERFVPPSDVADDVVEAFAASQEELKLLIGRTVNADWDKTMLTSSFQGFVTYSLRDAYGIIAAHQRRHIRQAERAMLESGFPAETAEVQRESVLN